MKPAFDIDAGPDPAFQSDADPDPAFQNGADTDPQHCYYSEYLFPYYIDHSN